MNIDKDKRKAIVAGSTITGGIAIFIFAWVGGLGFVPSIGYEQATFEPISTQSGQVPPGLLC